MKIWDQLSTEGSPRSAQEQTTIPAGVQGGGRAPLPRCSPERSIPQIARELGISDQSLRNWVNQTEIDAGEREGLTTEAREELRKLRREVKVLRQRRGRS
jgi:Transposase